MRKIILLSLLLSAILVMGAGKVDKITGQYREADSATAKASASDITTGTDDIKYATSKAIKDAGVVAPTVAGTGNLINGSDSKTSPADADNVAITNSADSHKLGKTTWANIKATLKTYFDGIYQTVMSKAGSADIIAGIDDAKYATAKALYDAGIRASRTLVAFYEVDVTLNTALDKTIISNRNATTDIVINMNQLGSGAGKLNDGFEFGVVNEVGINGLATGGTITTDGEYRVHTFTTNGTFEVEGTITCEVLVVAGGGGGGKGGGGGAGGLIHESAKQISQNSYNIVIGAGGTGSTSNSNAGGDGGNTTFADLEAFGGGGGGANTSAGRNGGSGGGAGRDAIVSGGTAVSGQGYAGGACQGTYYGGAGGGGGAGGAGYIGGQDNSPQSNNYGEGGIGLPYSITGEELYYAGGGGAYWHATGGGTCVGGLGGGGRGKGTAGEAVSGTPNTGGGGGGSFDGVAGAGGSGIVVIRYIPGVTSIITLTPDQTTPDQLPLTAAPGSSLQFSHKGDFMWFQVIDGKIICKSVFPAASNITDLLD